MVQKREFAILLDFVEAGFDLIGRLRGGTDRDANRFVQVFIDQTRDRLFYRGGKEQGLAVRQCTPEDAFDCREETHVEHAIRFIEHHGANGGKADQSAIEEITQASGRCYYDPSALPERVQLGSFGHSPHDDSGTDSRAAREKRDGLVNLDCEFTSWAENQSFDALATGFQKRFEERKREREGFAGAGLSGRDYIAAFEGWRNCPRLDRRGRNKFSLSQIPAKDRRANQVREIVH
jgi:hypothetical protein